AGGPERCRVVVHGVHELCDLVDRRAGERALDLLHEEARFVGTAGEPEQRQREERQRNEREQREVRDHRCEVRAAVGVELPPEITSSEAHAPEYAVSAMDAQQALADLTEISSQIQAAVVFDDKGKVAASTLDENRAGGLAEGAGRLLELAQGVNAGDGGVTQLAAASRAECARAPRSVAGGARTGNGSTSITRTAR